MNFTLPSDWIKGLIDTGIFLAIGFTLTTAIMPLIFRALTKLVPLLKDVSQDLMRLSRQIVFLITVDLIAKSFPIHDRFIAILEHFLFVVIVLALAHAAIQINRVLRNRLLPEHLHDFRPLFTKIFNLLVGTIALMVVMRHFDYNIWHIFTVLGIGSLAIGLAAQPTLTNMIAGFTLVLDRPFREGDFISLPGGLSGDVVRIGMRATRLQTPENHWLIVPNSDLVNARIVNSNLPSEITAQTLRFYFLPNQDLATVEQILLKATATQEEILPASASALVTNISTYWLELSLTYKIQSFRRAGTVNSQIYQKTQEELSAKGIRFSSLLTDVTVSRL